MSNVRRQKKEEIKKEITKERKSSKVKMQTGIQEEEETRQTSDRELGGGWEERLRQWGGWLGILYFFLVH